VLNLAAWDTAGRALACGRVQALDAATAQVRDMAVQPQHQGKGLGVAVLRALEDAAAKQGHTTLVLEARENAMGFYTRAGYEIVAKTHLLFGSVQHWRMQRML
jgi:GNAT superfamily N-acetyltransferase